MADFNIAQPYILRNEGGYANIKGDNGGQTYCGIARNPNPSWGGWPLIDSYISEHGEPKWNHIFTDAEIPGLEAMVSDFYQHVEWAHIKGDSIESQGVATYLYDFYVNAGGNAVKRLQRILGVTDDGVIGNATLQVLNAYTGDLLTALHQARRAYYEAIGTGHNAQFLKQWLERADSMYAACSKM